MSPRVHKKQCNDRYPRCVTLRRYRKARGLSLHVLSSLASVSCSCLFGLEKGRARPWNRYRGWSKPAKELADFFDCLPEELFPRYAMRAQEYLVDRLAVPVQAHPDQRLQTTELRATVQDSVLKACSPREALVVILHFGLDGNGCRSLDDISTLPDFKVSKARVGQIKIKALEHLRQYLMQRAPDAYWEALGDDMITLRQRELNRLRKYTPPSERPPRHYWPVSLHMLEDPACCTAAP